MSQKLKGRKLQSPGDFTCETCMKNRMEPFSPLLEFQTKMQPLHAGYCILALTIPTRFCVLLESWGMVVRTTFPRLLFQQVFWYGCRSACEMHLYECWKRNTAVLSFQCWWAFGYGYILSVSSIFFWLTGVTGPPVIIAPWWFSTVSWYWKVVVTSQFSESQLWR